VKDHENPAAPQKVVAAERQALALALRKQGGSYRKIAETLKKQPGINPKYAPSTAYHDVMAALKKLNEHNEELATEVRRLELERLDDLHAMLWPKAIKGDFASLDRVLGLMDRRARYLSLYAPQSVALTGKDGGPIEHSHTAAVTIYIPENGRDKGTDGGDGGGSTTE
jgi:hypothetical protein